MTIERIGFNRMDSIPHKRCIRCNVPKPRDDFYDSTRQKHLPPEARRKKRFCKDCEKIWRAARKDHENELRRIRRKGKRGAEKRRKEWRQYWLKRNYGMSITDYEILWNAQNGVCAICKQPETAIDPHNPGNVRRLSVDHDHETGKVRGLLCQRCNVAIGKY